MTGKLATTQALMLPLVVLIWAAAGFAQAAPGTPPAPPPQQQPASTPSTQPSGQEPADEVSISRPGRKRPRDYKKWTFNAGAGANMDASTTKTYVRQGGFVADVGAARNVSRYLGLRADFMFANLPLRDSTLELAQASGASSHVYAFALDPIVNLPVTSRYSGYFLAGPNFLHRSGSLNNETTVPGAACNGFWTWWGACQNFSIPLSGDFVKTSQNELGYNFGGGVAVKFPSGVQLYAEYRWVHGSHNGVTTDFRPITLGFRW